MNKREDNLEPDRIRFYEDELLVFEIGRTVDGRTCWSDGTVSTKVDAIPLLLALEPTNLGE